VYNAVIEELKRLSKAADNEFIPVKNWAEFAQNGGLEGAYDVEDIAPIATVLAELHKQRDLRVQTIYEVVGIADIMRGQTDPNETLGAQQLKARFGGDRLKKRQDRVQRWIRDLIRIKAEIIAEHFEPEKLAEITGFPWVPAPTPEIDPATGMPVIDPNTGQPVMQPIPEKAITPEIMQVLRTDRLRSYRIDVETDSTVFEDAEAEKQSRVELLSSMTQFIGAWAPIVAQNPTMLPLSFEMLAFGVRGFKTGRQLEETIEQTRMQLEESAKQMQAQGPQPSPEQQKLEAEAATKQQEQQAKQQEMEAKRAADEEERVYRRQVEDEERQYQRAQAEEAKAFEREKFDRDIGLKSAAHNKKLVDEANQAASEEQAEAMRGPTQLELALESFGQQSANLMSGLVSGLSVLAAGQENIAKGMEQIAAAQAESAEKQIEGLQTLAEIAAAPREAERDSSGRIVRVTPVIRGTVQ
jgi:hypothetical protein